MISKKFYVLLSILVLLNYYEIAFCDFSKNIRIGYDPDIKIGKLALIERNQDGSWKLKGFLDEPINKENENQELLILNIDKRLESIYVQPFFEADESWSYSGDIFFRCKVGSKNNLKFTPCNSKFTTFVSTEFFFLAGTTRYKLSKSAISKALEESKIIHELQKIVEDVTNKIEGKNNIQTSFAAESLHIPVPEFDGVYILTIDNHLIEVPTSNYDSLFFSDEISTKMDRMLAGGAVKFSITFTTEQYHHISTGRIKGLIVKGLDVNNIELKMAIRQVKLFSSSFNNDFLFYPDHSYSLTEFKRKTLNHSTFFYEPTSKRMFGNINKGIYLLVAYKNRNITWSSLCPNRKKGMLGFAHEKPMFWLIGGD